MFRVDKLLLTRELDTRYFVEYRNSEKEGMVNNSSWCNEFTNLGLLLILGQQLSSKTVIDNVHMLEQNTAK
jgi:hypothetical protein